MWSGVSSASPQIEHAGESTIFLRYNKFERHWGQKNSWTLGGAAFFQMKDLLGSRVAAILQLPVLVLAIVLLSQNSSPGWNSLCLSVDPCQSRSGCNSEAPFSEIHRTHRRRQDIPDYRRRCEEIGSKLRQRIVPEGDAASYAHLELEAHTSFNSHFTSVSLRVIMYRAEQHDCKENSLLNCMYLLLTIVLTA
jgi:hypothetical protein